MQKRLKKNANSDPLLQQVKDFNGFGTASKEELYRDIPYITNQFWTSRQKQGHSLHQISYRACFKSELPEWFIARTTKAGDWVLDPFQGRGTTPLQAALMGRNAAGNDINPLSRMLVEPRLSPPSIEEIEQELKNLPPPQTTVEDESLLTFFHPSTLLHLQALRARFREGNLNNAQMWIRMICLHLLTGHSSGYFSVKTMPPNQALSVESQQKINARLGPPPPMPTIADGVLKKSKKLLKSGGFPRVESKLLLGSADNLAGIENESVQLLVTSPPFLDIVQYADDNWMRSWFGGINPGSVAISMHRNPQEWQAMVARVLEEASRVLKPAGVVAFEVGEVSKKDKNGEAVLLEELVWQAVSEQDFKKLAVMVNKQDFTKTANLWGVSNNKKGTNTNRIVLLRKKD